MLSEFAVLLERHFTYRLLASRQRTRDVGTLLEHVPLQVKACPGFRESGLKSELRGVPLAAGDLSCRAQRQAGDGSGGIL